MIGIYQDSFLDYLKENLGEPIKVTPKNIITRCPWCEFGVEKKHYHLWISTESPIFHCFHTDCTAKSGIINKLIQKISGKDTSSQYVDRAKIKELSKKRLTFKRNVFKPKDILLPKLNKSLWATKDLYVRQRLKFSNINTGSIKGLVYDINMFIEMNDVQLDEKVERFKDYLHSNFVGFVSEHQSSITFRNIDRMSNFRYYKLKLQPSQLLDYYKLIGGKKYSREVVLAEGIFDIYTEHIYDSLGIKRKCSLYAAALSATSYASLIKSLVFHEQIFRPDIHILSDNGIDLNFYEKLKYFNKHIINKLTVYYNRSGKDFNDTPLNIVKHII
jgi:hypothetical protein